MLWVHLLASLQVHLVYQLVKLVQLEDANAAAFRNTLRLHEHILIAEEPGAFSEYSVRLVVACR